MANYHVINTTTKIVENTVVWDGDTSKWNTLDGYIAIGSTVGHIGYTYNSGGVGVGTTAGETNCMWIPPAE